MSEMIAPPTLPARGACADRDPFAWSVDESGPFAEAIMATATKVCLTACPAPVRSACLRHAMTAPEPWGVWGGLTPAQRRELASFPVRDQLPATA